MISFLLKNMKIVTYEEICNHYDKAGEIMDKIDHDDAVFIATALAFNAIILYHIRIALCFKLSTELRIFATSSLLKTTGSFLSFRGLLIS